MAGYDQIINVKAKYHTHAINFLEFLNQVGKRYSRNTKFTFEYLGRGRFNIIVDGQTGSIDALLQEMILNRGLYYYSCALDKKNREAVLDQAIIPLYQQLLEHRFENPYSKYLKKHVLGKLNQFNYIPGAFTDPFSHEYEVIFRRWDMGIISNWDYIKDADSFLTRFLLEKNGHKPGEKSGRFGILLNEVYKLGVGMDGEIRKAFEKIHSNRTKGLHRLESGFPTEELNNVSMKLYAYFQYYEEFDKSQKEKTIILHGKRFRRIKYGYEKFDEPDEMKVDGGKITWIESTEKNSCHDCFAVLGQYHCFGCDVEQCPRCSGQSLSCNCQLLKDIHIQFS